MSYHAASARNSSPCAVDIFLVYTKPKFRRHGLALRLLTQFKQSIKAEVNGPVLVRAALVNLPSYRLFRKVFGRPYALVGDFGYRFTESEVQEHLPAKIQRGRRIERMVNATFVLRRKELIL
jgi:FR47-like protein